MLGKTNVICWRVVLWVLGYKNQHWNSQQSNNFLPTSSHSSNNCPPEKPPYTMTVAKNTRTAAETASPRDSVRYWRTRPAQLDTRDAALSNEVRTVVSSRRKAEKRATTY
jgi:hypothetical protein